MALRGALNFLSAADQGRDPGLAEFGGERRRHALRQTRHHHRACAALPLCGDEGARGEQPGVGFHRRMCRRVEYQQRGIEARQHVSMYVLMALALWYVLHQPIVAVSDVSSVVMSFQEAAGVFGGRWREFGCGVVFGLGVAALVAMGPAGAALAISSSAIGMMSSVALHGAMLCAFA